MDDEQTFTDAFRKAHETGDHTIHVPGFGNLEHLGGDMWFDPAQCSILSEAQHLAAARFMDSFNAQQRRDAEKKHGFSYDDPSTFSGGAR